MWITARGARARTISTTSAERLHDAGFVVHEHHRDHGRAIVERVGEGVEIDDAAGIRADPLDPETLALEPRARGEHGLVLDGGGDDAVGAPLGRGPPTPRP